MAKKGKGDSSFEESGEESVLLNLNEVKAQSFDTVPKGTYDATITDVEYKLSQASGKPMWSMQLTITGGEYENRKLFHNMSFSEGALPGTVAALKRFAPELVTDNFNPKAVAESGDLIGREVRVKTKIETYNDQDSARIAQFLPKSGDAFA